MLFEVFGFGGNRREDGEGARSVRKSKKEVVGRGKVEVHKKAAAGGFLNLKSK